MGTILVPHLRTIAARSVPYRRPPPEDYDHVGLGESLLRRRRLERGRAPQKGAAVIRLAITQAAFDALAKTLPGSVGFENKTNEKGEVYVWLAPSVVNRLKAMRAPGEGYSDVILKLAAGDTQR
jgi:hypothetical protein